MIHKDKAIVIDLDGTIAKPKKKAEKYEGLKPNEKVVQKLKEYKKKRYYIIIVSSRNMRTFDGNIGKINAVTLKGILKWLDKHKVPYDEVHVGKPWCGFKGFCVDDKTIRPNEFVDLSLKEIRKLIQ